MGVRVTYGNTVIIEGNSLFTISPARAGAAAVKGPAATALAVPCFLCCSPPLPVATSNYRKTAAAAAKRTPGRCFIKSGPPEHYIG